MECPTCPKCHGTNALLWKKDETFYKMDGKWECRYCGKTIFKYKGKPVLETATQHRTGVNDDRCDHVLMITPRKSLDGGTNK